jgi:ferrochelatase
MRRAIVLLNLGGPLAKKDIAPFLFNFFMDKNIVGVPLPLRYLLAKWISYKRARGAGGSAYSHLNYKSPLLDNTGAQAAALENILREQGCEAQVFVSMRYWHPLSLAVARAVKTYNPDEIVLLPLYPQFSTTTTKSSFEDWDRAARKVGLKNPTRKIGCWPILEGFISASADNIREALKQAPANVRLLFSAHGLPEKIIHAGDPYQRQGEKTVAAIVDKLALPDLDWEICYQSRVGPLKWIGPSTDEALEKAALDKKSVVVYPHAFVSEHVETLVEIDMDYRRQAGALGIPYFGKATTVGTHPDFIAGLAALVLGETKGRCFQAGSALCCEKYGKQSCNS